MAVPVSGKSSEARPPSAISAVWLVVVARQAVLGRQFGAVGAGRTADIGDFDQKPRGVVDPAGTAAATVVTTTGSWTTTSLTAWPTALSVQAMAMTRTVPLKSGMSKLTLALPSGADFDDAGMKRHQHRGRRRRAGRAATAVAARADGAEHALRRVDQLAVKIAELHAELPLAIEPAIRIGRLEPREVEDAEIDGGDGDIGLLAGHGRRRDRASAVKA